MQNLGKRSALEENRQAFCLYHHAEQAGTNDVGSTACERSGVSMDAVARGAVGMGEMDSELVAGPERNGAGRTGHGSAGRNGTLSRCGYSERT